MKKPKNTCKSCGGAIVPEIDKRGICPECKRLDECVRDHGHVDRSDLIRIENGFRRLSIV